MADDNQTVIPRSFIELFIPAGASSREPRAVIAERYELCEDMARMLTEHARSKLWELGVTEQDVLDRVHRVHRGLLVDGSVIAEDEAGWVICRLAELLEWPRPDLPAQALPQAAPAAQDNDEVTERDVQPLRSAATR